jgi:hypothetical protein
MFRRDMPCFVDDFYDHPAVSLQGVHGTIAAPRQRDPTS